MIGQLLDAADGLGDEDAIREALTARAKAISVDELASIIEESILRGAMLGALDSLTSREQDEDEKLLTFYGASKPLLLKGSPDTSVPLVYAPFTEAISIFEKREILDRGDFERLKDGAKRKAFAVAGLAKGELLAATHGELDRMLKRSKAPTFFDPVTEQWVYEGPDLRQFRKFAEERLESAGWTPANRSHVETIFRTNIGTAYSSGRFVEMTQPTVLAVRPYWQIQTVKDSRQRQTHKAADGVVLPADHPFWREAFPPFGFNCRCRVVARSQRWADAHGGISRVPTGLPDKGFDSGTTALLVPGGAKGDSPAKQKQAASDQKKAKALEQKAKKEAAAAKKLAAAKKKQAAAEAKAAKLAKKEAAAAKAAQEKALADAAREAEAKAAAERAAADAAAKAAAKELEAKMASKKAEDIAKAKAAEKLAQKAAKAAAKQQTLKAAAEEKLVKETAKQAAVEVHTQVKDQIFSITGGSVDHPIQIKDLRAKFPGMSKEDFDKSLIELQRQNRIALYRDDTSGDVGFVSDSAVIVGGQPRHIVYWKLTHEEAKALRDARRAEWIAHNAAIDAEAKALKEEEELLRAARMESKPVPSHAVKAVRGDDNAEIEIKRLRPKLEKRSVNTSEITRKAEQIRRTTPITEYDEIASKERGVYGLKPHQRDEIAAYQEHSEQAFASGGPIDEAARDSVVAFSNGYDTTIRDISSGNFTFDEVVKRRFEGMKKTNHPETMAASLSHTREAYRYATDLERAFWASPDGTIKDSYRGIKMLDTPTLNKILGDDVVDLQGKPSSTSAVFHVAQGFATPSMLADKPEFGHSIIFKFTNRKTKGIPMTAVSDFQPELELLLHGNTKWRVKSRTRIPHEARRLLPDGAEEEAWFMELEEID